MIGESEETTHGAVSTILSKLGEDETLVRQTRSNSESQFEESPDLQSGTDDAVLGAGDVLSRVSEIIFAGDADSERARQLIARAFYRTQNCESPPSTDSN